MERAAWGSFVAVIHGFLGNHKAENYVNWFEFSKRITPKWDAKCLDKFKENMGAYSEEQGKLFHQDISDYEHRYQREYNENMMGDYI